MQTCKYWRAGYHVPTFGTQVNTTHLRTSVEMIRLYAWAASNISVSNFNCFVLCKDSTPFYSFLLVETYWVKDGTDSHHLAFSHVFNKCKLFTILFHCCSKCWFCVVIFIFIMSSQARNHATAIDLSLYGVRYRPWKQSTDLQLEQWNLSFQIGLSSLYLLQKEARSLAALDDPNLSHTQMDLEYWNIYLELFRHMPILY